VSAGAARGCDAFSRTLGDEIRARYDPGFEVGRQLLAGVRAGWLKAMRADVGVERKLRAPAEAG
jgi:hypothetical protein